MRSSRRGSQTSKDSLTCWKGRFTESATFALASFANLLKLAPGNHSGTYLTVGVSTIRFLRKNPFEWNSYGWGGSPRGRFQASWRNRQQPSHPRMRRKTCHSRTLRSPRTQSTRPKTRKSCPVKRLVMSPGNCKDWMGTDVQMDMLQEALRRLGEPTKEDVHCLVDLVVELVHG